MSEVNDEVDVLDPFKPIDPFTDARMAMPYEECPNCGEMDYRTIKFDLYKPDSKWFTVLCILSVGMRPAQMARMHGAECETWYSKHCMNCHYVERDVRPSEAVLERDT